LDIQKALNIQNIRKRVVDLLTNPEIEWGVLSREDDDIVSLYTNYIMPLAAIPSICLLLGLMIVGAPFIGRYGIVMALGAAIGGYVAALVAPMIAAVVIEQLAPKFGSSGDTLRALKLVAYSSTPIWLAGIVYLVPLLAFLAIVGALYAVYLFYVGLPVMMRTPREQVVPYMVVSAITIIVISIVLRFVQRFAGLPMYGI